MTIWTLNNLISECFFDEIIYFRVDDDSETPTNARTPDEDYDVNGGYRLPTAGGQTAVNNNGVGVPHIPEPDYDISDAENGSYSGSDSSWRNGGGSGGMAPSEDPIGTRGREPSTATLRRNQQQRQDRKKKKTVSFIMNQDIANIIHSSGTMTKKESILKVIFIEYLLFC